MKKTLALIFFLFLSSSIFASSNEEAIKKIDAFFNKADYECEKLKEEAPNLSPANQLRQFSVGYRKYFAKYSDDSMQLMFEIMSSAKYSKNEKSEFLKIFKTRHQAIIGAYHNKLDYYLERTVNGK